MKHSMMVAIAGACLLAGCGVDREGTREEIVKTVEAAGGKADPACVDGVFSKYSDDELTAIDDEMGKNPTTMSDAANGLFTALFGCISLAS